jgi:hypothetical protein
MAGLQAKAKGKRQSKPIDETTAESIVQLISPAYCNITSLLFEIIKPAIEFSESMKDFIIFGQNIKNLPKETVEALSRHSKLYLPELLRRKLSDLSSSLVVEISQVRQKMMSINQVLKEYTSQLNSLLSHHKVKPSKVLSSSSGTTFQQLLADATNTMEDLKAATAFQDSPGYQSTEESPLQLLQTKIKLTLARKLELRGGLAVIPEILKKGDEMLTDQRDSQLVGQNIIDLKEILHMNKDQGAKLITADFTAFTSGESENRILISTFWECAGAKAIEFVPLKLNQNGTITDFRYLGNSSAERVVKFPHGFIKTNWVIGFEYLLEQSKKENSDNCLDTAVLLTANQTRQISQTKIQDEFFSSIPPYESLTQHVKSENEMSESSSLEYDAQVFSSADNSVIGKHLSKSLLLFYDTIGYKSWNLTLPENVKMLRKSLTMNHETETAWLFIFYFIEQIAQANPKLESKTVNKYKYGYLIYQRKAEKDFTLFGNGFILLNQAQDKIESVFYHCETGYFSVTTRIPDKKTTNSQWWNSREFYSGKFDPNLSANVQTVVHQVYSYLLSSDELPEVEPQQDQDPSITFFKLYSLPSGSDLYLLTHSMWPWAHVVAKFSPTQGMVFVSSVYSHLTTDESKLRPNPRVIRTRVLSEGMKSFTKHNLLQPLGMMVMLQIDESLHFHSSAYALSQRPDIKPTKPS